MKRKRESETLSISARRTKRFPRAVELKALRPGLRAVSVRPGAVGGHYSTVGGEPRGTNADETLENDCCGTVRGQHPVPLMHMYGDEKKSSFRVTRDREFLPANRRQCWHSRNLLEAHAE